MNVFVLSTGRSGTHTFVKACGHITNYTARHESRLGIFTMDAVEYPPNHIEVDGRLSWFTGNIDKRFGNEAIYIHLKRNREDCVKSWIIRCVKGIFNAFIKDLVYWKSGSINLTDAAEYYVDTVNNNIELLLKDKTNKMDFQLENAKEDWPKFWELIGAKGDYTKGLMEFTKMYNCDPSKIRIIK